MDAGSSLDEARRLRDQHNDLMMKLQVNKIFLKFSLHC